MNYPSAMEAYSHAMKLVSLSRSDGGLPAHKAEAAHAGWLVAGYASSVMFGSPSVMRLSAPGEDDLQVAGAVNELLTATGGQVTYSNDLIDGIDKFRAVMVEFLEWFYSVFLDRAFDE